MICLEVLAADHSVPLTRTACYHYFHCECLNRYVVHSRKELEERAREDADNRVDISTTDSAGNLNKVTIVMLFMEKLFLLIILLDHVTRYCCCCCHGSC
jgi:hypothetical protein